MDGATTDEVNCAPHYDPWLLSIGGVSTCKGLQLKERSSDQWIDRPTASDVGVIWLGAAAPAHVKNSRLKPGIHRVIYPQTENVRLAIWCEVCTIEQLRNVSQDKGDQVTFDGSLDLPPIKVPPGESKKLMVYPWAK